MKLPSKRHISEFFSRAALFGAMFIALSLSNARAAELVMFEQAGCAWCEAFDREIAPIYGKTEEGLRAPLRRVDTAQGLPPGLGVHRNRTADAAVRAGRPRPRNRPHSRLSRRGSLLGPARRVDEKVRCARNGWRTRAAV